MRIAIAALFVSTLFASAACLDNDQPQTDQTQEKNDPDTSDDNNGVGDPGSNNALNGVTDPEAHGNYGDGADPQTGPQQTCHERIKATGRCE